MRSVGLFEAKNGLSALVERVSKGEEIVITRRGQKVAMLVPANRCSHRAAAEVVASIRKSRKGVRVPKGFSIRQMIEAGRRP